MIADRVGRLELVKAATDLYTMFIVLHHERTRMPTCVNADGQKHFHFYGARSAFRLDYDESFVGKIAGKRIRLPRENENHHGRKILDHETWIPGYVGFLLTRNTLLG
ncbi:hypothetical protein EVAR_53952_1 [Eumeta japonica]|uniref:Uncharacterized protein n=1 Tax=Eumeta variegata TaxID=151549 RepID=A0A4C1Y2C2_EUMVA|nr:hypothetical protein EVAR_53952_1 [Eumeta japonica]